VVEEPTCAYWSHACTWSPISSDGRHGHPRGQDRRLRAPEAAVHEEERDVIAQREREVALSLRPRFAGTLIAGATCTWPRKRGRGTTSMERPATGKLFTLVLAPRGLRGTRGGLDLTLLGRIRGFADTPRSAIAVGHILVTGRTRVETERRRRRTETTTARRSGSVTSPRLLALVAKAAISGRPPPGRGGPGLEGRRVVSSSS